MKENTRNLTTGQLDYTFTRRSLFVGGVQGSIGVLLAARMGYISLFENEKYKLMAESNRVNLTLIPPRRGWFIDRAGKPIGDPGENARRTGDVCVRERRQPAA